MISGLISAVMIAAGFPGLESRADYDMIVSLHPDSSMIRGSTEIIFTNGMDFPVDTLWLHLYPNAYRDHTTALPIGQSIFCNPITWSRSSPFVSINLRFLPETDHTT